MQEEIKEPLPKNVFYMKRSKSYGAMIQENNKKYLSKPSQNLRIALYFADIMINKNGLNRNLFLTDQEFKSCYLDNIVYFETEEYFNRIETIKKKGLYYISRICRECNSTNLVFKSDYKYNTFKKHYPDTEYYKCKKCAAADNGPTTDEHFIQMRKGSIQKKISNTSGYVGIIVYKKYDNILGWKFICINKGVYKGVSCKETSLEEMVWLRDDYIRHMGFDNILNLTDEEYFAQEFKYKFNKKIDWRKNETSIL